MPARVTKRSLEALGQELGIVGGYDLPSGRGALRDRYRDLLFIQQARDEGDHRAAEWMKKVMPNDED